MPESDPASLEFSLCERYQFYTDDSVGLWRARVHQEPYQLCEARAEVDGSLLNVLGLPDNGARTPDFYSPGVEVEIVPMTRVV